jgi:hypothetical protein
MKFHEVIWRLLVSSIMCDAILYELHDHPPAWKDDSLNEGKRRVAWLHIMKTASSFGTTLAHYANRSLPKDAHIPGGMDEDDPEDDIERKVDDKTQKLVLDFFAYKYPVPIWFKGIFRHPENPGDHLPITDQDWKEWDGAWVTVLRQPEERLSSAFHHFARGKGSVRSFQKTLQGQQAAMLSLGDKGIPWVTCERHGGGEDGPEKECENLPKPDVQKALERLKEFRFVGILEEYDLSVCLFHKMYDSDCFPVAFDNSRPTPYQMSEKEQQKEIAELKKNPDPWDTPVYEFARERFKNERARYNVNEHTCREICPGGPWG